MTLLSTRNANKFFVFVAVLVCVTASVSFLGCPIQQMTAKQRATSMMGTYNSQYADYMNQLGYAFDPGQDKWVKVRDVQFTDDRKKVLSERKKILMEVYPLIQTYQSAVSGGLEPSRSIENQIIALLNRL